VADESRTAAKRDLHEEVSAVDAKGNVLVNTGTTWASAKSIDGTKTLSSVSCPLAPFCVAVDTSGNDVKGTAATATSQLTWNTNGSLPLVLSDGTNDYIYGPTGEPVEQVNVTSSPPTSNPLFLTYTPSDSSWLVTTASGNQLSYYRYDAFGNLALGTPTSPFGYAGQYADTSSSPSGFDNLRARWYQPQTGQFTTWDPAFAQTNQAYDYAGEDPVNGSDPSGLWSLNPIADVVQAATDIGHAANAALPVVHSVANVIAIGASFCAAVTSETIVGGATCGTVALAAGAVTAGSGLALYAEGRESGTRAAIEVGSAGLGGLASLLEAGAAAARVLAESAEATSLLREAETEAAPWYGKVSPWLSAQLWAAKSAFWNGLETGMAAVARVASAGGFGLGVYGDFSGSCR